MNRIQSVFRILLLLLLTVSILSLPLINASSVKAEDEPAKIGVLAKRGTAHCLQKWSATAEYLSQNISGYSFSIVPLNFDQIIPATEKGEIDFALTNPAYYVSLEINQKVDRLATLINKDIYNKPMNTFAGVVFTRANRQDIISMKDLVGKRFVSVAPKALGAWLAVLREMTLAGINPQKDFTTLSFAGTQDATVYSVRDGKADAGSVRTSTLERMAEEGKINLADFKVVQFHLQSKSILPEHHLPHSTRSYPEWPISRLNHVDNALAKQVAHALIKMPSDSHAAQSSHSYGWSNPLNYQPVHNCLRELKVEPYRDYGKFSPADAFRQYWSYILSATLMLLLFFLISIRLKKLNLNLENAVAQKNFELTLRQEVEERLNETQRIALLGSWEWDIVNNSLWWSEETYHIFEFQSGDKTSYDKFIDAIHPDDRSKVLELTKEAAEKGFPLQLDYRIIVSDAELRYIHEKSRPVYDDKKRIVKRMGSVQDVTLQKKSEIDLQDALDEIKTLKGVLPICMHCKAIRDEKGAWNQLEKYITEHSDAQFSHGICEKCLKKHYPELME